MAVNLSTTCSTAIKSNRSFASTEFISPRYEEIEHGREHQMLQKYDYRLHYLNGEVARPIFGLGVTETIALVHQLLDIPDWGWNVSFYRNFHQEAERELIH